MGIPHPGLLGELKTNTTSLWLNFERELDQRWTVVGFLWTPISVPRKVCSFCYSNYRGTASMWLLIRRHVLVYTGPNPLDFIMIKTNGHSILKPRISLGISWFRRGHSKPLVGTFQVVFYRRIKIWATEILSFNSLFVLQDFPLIFPKAPLKEREMTVLL